MIEYHVIILTRPANTSRSTKVQCCAVPLQSYTCTCHTGYTGLHCETDVDECLSTPCQHDSTCLQRSNEAREDFTYDSAAGYDCQCTPGYTGMSLNIVTFTCNFSQV